MYADYREAVNRTVKITRRHEPDPAMQEVYEKNYEIYLQLYENLKDLMKKDGGSRK
jgi:xylulokinase